MVTTYELELFAKEASANYLKDKTSLNESITKLAETHALNKEQVARVVEVANTDVYLNLFNKTADKYVQYDVADPAVIEQNLGTVKIAEVADISDYYEPPIYEMPAFEKVASIPEEKRDSSDEVMRDYWRFKGAEAHLEGLLLEGQQTFNQEAQTLQQMIKQAVLEGNAYNDIYNALSTNKDPIFTETLKGIETELSQILPEKLLTKTASTLTHTVNVNHPLMQQSFKLVKIANEF